MSEVTLGTRRIGPGAPPFVVAEMSGNHNGSLERALRIVEAAAQAGAHCVKLQTYTADTMTIDVREREFLISDPGSPWRGRTLYDLYREAHTPWEWHEPLFERCRSLGVVPASTPFDESAVDFLERLDTPLYKVASFEITDIPLLRRIARTGRPMVVSTGMATVAEIDEAVRTVRAAGCEDLVLLKCTSAYPAPPEHANLATIPHLRELFRCQTGLSDHTLGTGVALAAVALGATFIEKHFTLRRADGGVDAAFSLEPEELASLVAESERAWRALGRVSYGPAAGERGSLAHRRSLYVVEDVRPGDIVSERNVRAIRPGLGLAPGLKDVVIGRRFARAASKGTPLSWDLIGA